MPPQVKTSLQLFFQEALAIDEQILQQKDAELRLLQQKVVELNQECTNHIQALEEERERTHIKVRHMDSAQWYLFCVSSVSEYFFVSDRATGEPTDSDRSSS